MQNTEYANKLYEEWKSITLVISGLVRTAQLNYILPRNARFWMHVTDAERCDFMPPNIINGYSSRIAR